MEKSIIIALVLGSVGLLFGVVGFGLAVNTHIGLTSGTADISARSGRFENQVSAGGTRDNPGVILNGQGVCKDGVETNQNNNVACTSVDQLQQTVVQVEAGSCACSGSNTTTNSSMPSINIVSGTCELQLVYANTLAQATTYTIVDHHVQDDLYTRVLNIAPPATGIVYPDGTNVQAALQFANFAPLLRENASPVSVPLYTAVPSIVMANPGHVVTEAALPNTSPMPVTLVVGGLSLFTVGPSYTCTVASGGFQIALGTVVH